VIFSTDQVEFRHLLVRRNERNGAVKQSPLMLTRVRVVARSSSLEEVDLRALLHDIEPVPVMLPEGSPDMSGTQRARVQFDDMNFLAPVKVLVHSALRCHLHVPNVPNPRPSELPDHKSFDFFLSYDVLLVKTP
jgi:hypothetical protein